jgi:Zn-dependent M28 family amino/carboxypeptidase
MFSDHAPFVEKGIPAIWQLSKVAPGVFNRGWGHTSADTLDKIDERELREAAMMAGMIVLRLIFSEEFPLMPRHED